LAEAIEFARRRSGNQCYYQHYHIGYLFHR
jgi:hypothetical protein